MSQQKNNQSVPFRSEDLYRSVAAQEPRNFGDAARTERVSDKNTAAVHGTTVGAASAKVTVQGPKLPLPLDVFPVQPLSAILTGSYTQCYDTYAKALSTPGCGVILQSAKRDEGKFLCTLDKDADAQFYVQLWCMPGEEKVLMELITLAPESRYSWSEVFERLTNVTASTSILCCRQSLYAPCACPIGQFVNPVL